jgi:hypothetical protein
MPYEIGCSSIRYEIYEVDYDGTESYSETIYQDVEYDWI